MALLVAGNLSDPVTVTANMVGRVLGSHIATQYHVLRRVNESYCGFDRRCLLHTSGFVFPIEAKLQTALL